MNRKEQTERIVEKLTKEAICRMTDEELSERMKKLIKPDIKKTMLIKNENKLDLNERRNILEKIAFMGIEK